MAMAKSYLLEKTAYEKSNIINRHNRSRSNHINANGMTSESTTTAAPVAQQERITILDSLRGIAILGILLMNVPGFGLPYAQAGDPSIQNETGLNFKAWFIVEGALSGTQRAIFSMLFGAGL